MTPSAHILLPLVLTASACSTAANNDAAAGSALGSCDPGATLTGAPYDLGMSRFAFGSAPVRNDIPGMTRWVGSDGAVAIESCGAELGVMNAGAAEASLRDWSADPAALSAHVRDYFVSMGVDACQIANTSVLGMVGGGGGQRVIALARGVDGIAVAESNASARFNSSDQSTSESFYWPTVSADAVSGARAFRVQLADAAGLAAFKAKLPATAQGDGQIVIHHSTCALASSASFQSAATYDVVETNPMGMGAMLRFDAQGNPVSTIW